MSQVERSCWRCRKPSRDGILYTVYHCPYNSVPSHEFFCSKYCQHLACLHQCKCCKRLTVCHVDDVTCDACHVRLEIKKCTPSIMGIVSFKVVVPEYYLNRCAFYYVETVVAAIPWSSVSLLGKPVLCKLAVYRSTVEHEGIFHIFAQANPRRAQSAALLLLGAVKYRALGLTRDTARIVARLVWAQRYDRAWLALDL